MDGKKKFVNRAGVCAGEKTAALRCKAERLEMLHQSYRVLKLVCANCRQAFPIHPAAQPLPSLLKKGPKQLAPASSPVLCRGHGRRIRGAAWALPPEHDRGAGHLRQEKALLRRKAAAGGAQAQRHPHAQGHRFETPLRPSRLRGHVGMGMSCAGITLHAAAMYLALHFIIPCDTNTLEQIQKRGEMSAPCSAMCLHSMWHTLRVSAPHPAWRTLNGSI